MAACTPASLWASSQTTRSKAGIVGSAWASAMRWLDWYVAKTTRRPGPARNAAMSAGSGRHGDAEVGRPDGHLVAADRRLVGADDEVDERAAGRLDPVPAELAEQEQRGHEDEDALVFALPRRSRAS